MHQHDTWFKRSINPILRLLGFEIFSAVRDDKVVGYGIRFKGRDEAL